MALPNTYITPLPNNEPDAVPALWNVRYEEIDENFSAIDQRTGSVESEISQARGTKPSLGDLLSEFGSKLDQVAPESQDQMASTIAFALDQAGVANRSVAALKGQIQQEGQVTLLNRGVVSGCTVDRSDNAARNLNFSGGVVFMSGRKYSAPLQANAASVPPNTTGSSAVVRAYLYLHGASQSMRLAVTEIGDTMPEDAIHIYNVTIPSNSTDISDPNLGNVSLASVRRVEPSFPRAINAPIVATVGIKTLRDTEYRLDFDVVGFSGGVCDPDQVKATSRATNGFTIELLSECDNVVLRWRASKLNNN